MGRTVWPNSCALSHTFFEVSGHVEVGEWKGDMSADLGGEVGIKSEPFQVDTQHLGMERGRKNNDGE